MTRSLHLLKKHILPKIDVLKRFYSSAKGNCCQRFQQWAQNHPQNSLSYVTRYKKALCGCIQKVPALLERRHLVFVHDLCMCALALFITFWIRTEGVYSFLSPGDIIKHILIFMLVSAAVFLWLQLYRGVWRYISVHESISVIFAAGYASALYFPLMVLMSTNTYIPRSSIFLLFALTAFFLLSSRIAYRFTQIRWLDDHEPIYQSKPLSRVLLMGTFQEISLCLQKLKDQQTLSFEVLGALTSDEKDVGRFIQGIEILGEIRDLETIISHFNLEDKHPHHLVLLGQKSDNLQALKTLARLLPKLGIDLMHFVERQGSASTSFKTSLDLAPLSYKDLAPLQGPETEPASAATSKISKTPLSKKRILLFGASHQVGQALTEKLLSQGQENLALSDLSLSFIATCDAANTSSQHSSRHTQARYLPLPGTSSDDFRDVITEATPTLILALPPLISEAFFVSSPTRAIQLIRPYMLNLLEACLTLQSDKVVFLFPHCHQDFKHSYLQRYYNLLQAEMCRYVSAWTLLHEQTQGNEPGENAQFDSRREALSSESAQKNKTELFFLYTGDFAESPDSLLNSIKTALENERSPLIRASLDMYEFSSVESLSEKIIDYLLRLVIASQDIPLESHLKPDMISTPEELMDQIKALYPLPYNAQKIHLKRHSLQEPAPHLKPFSFQASEQKGHYLIKEAPLLDDLLNKIKTYTQMKEDKKIMEILS